MKKLTEKQINELAKFRDNGGTFVYLRIRKYYSSSYVRLFYVQDLLNNKYIPSYWYTGKGDCTENQALKDGFLNLALMKY